MSFGNFKFVVVSDVDMSQRPEGATHFGPAVDGYQEGWFKATDNGFQIWVPLCRNWGRDGLLTSRRFATLIECEAQADQSWSGEGIPQVGTILEYLTLDKGEYWCEAVVKYVGSHMIIVSYEHPREGNAEACMNHAAPGPKISTRIRPIRTPEQIATDARQTAAIDLYRAVMDHSGQNFLALPKDRQDHYLKLVDEGWQKVPRA